MNMFHLPKNYTKHNYNHFPRTDGGRKDDGA